MAHSESKKPKPSKRKQWIDGKRKEKGMTQVELADALYISESTLSRKLNGQIPFMEVEEFRMFCELNLSAEEIWGYYSCFVDTETLNYLRNVIEKAGHKLP